MNIKIVKYYCRMLTIMIIFTIQADKINIRITQKYNLHFSSVYCPSAPVSSYFIHFPSLVNVDTLILYLIREKKLALMKCFTYFSNKVGNEVKLIP